MKIALIEVLLAALAIGSLVWYIDGDFTNKFKEFLACVIGSVSIIAFILWTLLAPFLV